MTVTRVLHARIVRRARHLEVAETPAEMAALIADALVQP